MPTTLETLAALRADLSERAKTANAELNTIVARAAELESAKTAKQSQLDAIATELAAVEAKIAVELARPPVPPAPSFVKVMGSPSKADATVINAGRADRATGYWCRLRLAGTTVEPFEAYRGKGYFRADDWKADKPLVSLLPGARYEGEIGAYNKTGDGPGKAFSFSTQAEVVAVPAATPIPEPPKPVETPPTSLLVGGLFDGAGKLYIQQRPAGADQFITSADDTIFQNLSCRSAVDETPKPGATRPTYSNGILLKHNRCTVRDVGFEDECGGGIMVDGSDCRIEQVRFATFQGYAIYTRAPKNLFVEDFTVVDFGPDGIAGTADDDGGSNTESSIRFGNDYSGGGTTTGVLRRVRVWNFARANKQAIRGAFDGEIIDSEFHGNGFPPVNLSPMGGGDGGENYLWDGGWSVTHRGDVAWGDPAAVAAAWRAMIDAGIVDPAEFFVAAKVASPIVRLNTRSGVAQIAADSLTDADWASFIRRREITLAQYSNVRFTRTWIDSQCGKEPGAEYRFNDGCKVGKPGIDKVFGKDAAEYPAKLKQLPWDVLRKRIPVTFAGRVELFGNALGVPESSIVYEPGAVVTLNGIRISP